MLFQNGFWPQDTLQLWFLLLLLCHLQRHSWHGDYHPDGGWHLYLHEGQNNTDDVIQPWARQIKPFSSLRKKIANYEQEKKENNEKRNSNPFTPVREKTLARKEAQNIENWTWDILHPQLQHPHAQLQPSPPPQLPCLPLLPLACMLLLPLACQAIQTLYPCPSHQHKDTLTKHGQFTAPHQHWCHYHYTWTGPQIRTVMVLNRKRGRGSVNP